MSKVSVKVFKDAYHYITSKWGWRTYQYNGQSITDFHKGTDYGTNGKKIPQYAIEDGQVYSAGKDSAGGIFAWIYYPRLNVRMLHYHLDSVAVTKGQVVNKNTLIGYTGTTGHSTGIHLHFGVYDIAKGDYVDPEVYASNYTEPEVTPEPTPEPLKYNVGDQVEFTGVLYADADGNGAGQERTNLVTHIQYVAPGKSMPYHITDLGWVKAEDVSDYVAPTPEPKPARNLAVGDTVKIIGTGNGSSAGNRNTAYGIGWIRTIRKIYPGRVFPYQVGNASGTTGFYKADALELQ